MQEDKGKGQALRTTGLQRARPLWARPSAERGWVGGQGFPGNMEGSWLLPLSCRGHMMNRLLPPSFHKRAFRIQTIGRTYPQKQQCPVNLTNLALQDPHCTVRVLPFLGGLEVALPPTDTLKQLDCPGPTENLWGPVKNQYVVFCSVTIRNFRTAEH